MKILHVVDSCGLYGKEKVVLSLLKLDGEIYNVSNNVEFNQELENIYGPFIKNSNNPIEYLEYFDIIHCHDFKSSVLAFWWSLNCPLNKRPKLIRTLHGYTATKSFSKKGLYRFLDKLILCFFDKVIPVNGGKDAILNGIPIEDTSLHLEKLSSKIIDFMSEGIILASVGRLSREKNYHSLITALAMITNKNLKLIILGEGNERENLERLVKDLNLQERVMMPGFIKFPKEVVKFCDFYIQPSLTEGVPISVLETMPLGKTMLLTSVGGMTDIIKADAAIQIEMNPQSIATKLDMLIGPDFVSRIQANTTGKKRRVSDRALEMFKKLYTETKMIDCYSKVYADLV